MWLLSLASRFPTEAADVTVLTVRGGLPCSPAAAYEGHPAKIWYGDEAWPPRDWWALCFMIQVDHSPHLQSTCGKGAHNVGPAVFHVMREAL